jgi:HEAT repeat protein
VTVVRSGRTPADQTERRRQAALAGHLGDVARAEQFLASEDPVVRATALRALERAGPQEPDALARFTTDPSASVRRAVAELIGGRPEPELDSALCRLLDDEQDDVIEAAAFAAGERQRPADPIVDRLVELTTDHDDPLVREAAVAALGALGDSRGVAAILRATHDRATVRRRAVLALAPFDGDDVDAALRRALADRDWQVRQAAEDLLSP